MMNAEDKYKVVIVDDERTAIDALRRELGAYQEFEIKGTANNGAKGKKMIMELRPDLLFLDVELGNENGIQWVKKWRKTRKFQDIIIASSYDHYVFDSIEVRPFAYIRKAHLEEDLRKAVRRYWKESREEPIYVIVKDGKKNILVDPYHIDYLQANGHYIDIIMDNEEPIVVRNHINELQHTLEKYGFVRVQVSYLVNVKFIERFDGKNVYLRNGIKKFVSPHFEKQLLEKLRSYMESDGDDLNGDTG